MKEKKVTIAWWSAGITSAVACKFALELYDNVQLYYIDTGAGHEDNKRFIKDCENWYGQKINIIKNSKGFENHVDVALKSKYLNGVHGSPCTGKLKKDVRFELEKQIDFEHQIFGFEFTKKEINRAIRFKEQHSNTKPLFPLIEKKLDKNQCAWVLKEVGIELPTMYKLGYSNNNCIGCLKGGKGYFNKIKKDFPNWFNKVAEAERIVGATCLKDMYLDELKGDEGREGEKVMAECGIFCQVELADLISDKTNKILNGELDINDI